MTATGQALARPKIPANPRRRFAVIAGGGTAGHLVPVLAVARALVAQGRDPSTIELVASRRASAPELLEACEFPVTLLPGRGLRRSLAPGDLVANAAAGFGLGVGVARALGLLAAWRPQVVVTVGGYASFPAGLAAAALRRPVVLVNTDAVPGLANRALAPFASAAAVAFPGTPLRRAVVTGTPLAEAMAEVDRSGAGRRAAKEALGVPPERLLVVAFGGSLGARRINEAVATLARRWGSRADLALYHVVGRRNFDRAAALSEGHPGGLWHEVVPFEHRMALLYSAADVMVCRAGAMTVAELAAAGVPAVLVPLPGAPGDHQAANASVLANVGGAEVLYDEACRSEVLETTLEALLCDPPRRARMEAAASSLGRPRAAAEVAALIEEVAGRRGR